MTHGRRGGRGGLLPWTTALLAAAAGAALFLVGPAQASSSPLRAGFLQAPLSSSRQRTAAAAAAGSSSSSSSSGSSSGSGSLESKKQRLVVADGLDFDAMVARQHDLMLQEELRSPPPSVLLQSQQSQQSQSGLAAPSAAAPSAAVEAAPDREVLGRLTELFYHAMNERNAQVLSQLWLEDPGVVFFAGDEGGMTTGYVCVSMCVCVYSSLSPGIAPLKRHVRNPRLVSITLTTLPHTHTHTYARRRHAAVVDLLQTIRREERELDPAKKGLMLHPPVEPSAMRVVVNGMHAWVRCLSVCLCVCVCVHEVARVSSSILAHSVTYTQTTHTRPTLIIITSLALSPPFR